MGQFNINITAVGGHGCQRAIGDGEEIPALCGSSICPDCHARTFVQELKDMGCMVESAMLTHWPGTTGEVSDDLVEPWKRIGNF